MKRVVLMLLFFISLANAALTKDDVRSIVREELDIRFNLQQKYLEAKFEAIDRRFEAIDKRFEAIDNRFNDQMSFLYMITAIFTTFTMGVIGFALWDRASIVQKASDEAVKEIKKDKKLENLIGALKELSNTDDKLANVLKNYGII